VDQWCLSSPSGPSGSHHFVVCLCTQLLSSDFLLEVDLVAAMQYTSYEEEPK
jgi:hypothetical protein